MGTVIDVPTFYPTEEEFADFSKYIAHIEDKHRAHEYGLVKVVPPKSWVARANYEGLDDTVMVTNPIEQEIQGQHGAYQAMNLVRKHMTMGEFKKIAESPKHAPPACHENYKELERYFWKNVTFNKAIYGADVPGTLFADDLDTWNLSRLDTMLNIIHEEHDVVISGVNTAYLYFGMWKSAFAWHTEDMNLYSINYLHFGHPKSWYGIPPAQGKKLEDLARLYYAEGFNHCKEFLRHKSTMLAPALLKKSGVPYIRAIQEPGEFMITFPYSYHAGFNHGFNCAEATNFASDHWIDWGLIAQACKCRPDTVRINTDIFVKRFRPEQWADMHPNDTDPEDCGGPIKRRMGGGRSMGAVMGGRSMTGVPVKKFKGESGREESEIDSKRKQPPPQKMTKEMAFAAERDFNRQVAEGPAPHQPICAVCRCAGTALAPKMEAGEEDTGHVVLDQSLFEVAGGDVGATGVVVCATCNVAVHTVCYGLAPTDVSDPTKWQCARCVAAPASVVMCELCPNAGGAFARCHGNTWVHVQCAQWVPEATLRLVGGTANETCWDISNVPKERWALKCKVCVDSSSVRQRDQKGVCVQCCEKGCTVGYHVTCAQDTGHGSCDWGHYPMGPWWVAYCTHRHMPLRLRQLECADTSKYAVGTRVMCRFPQDNCHYPGTIVAISTDHRLHWRDEEGARMVWAQPKEVVVIDGDGKAPEDARAYQGRKVECVSGKNRYSFGVVEQVEATVLYRVHFDDGYLAPKAKFTDLVLLERWDTDRPPGARAGEESVVPLCVTGQSRRRVTTDKPKDEGLKIRRTLRHMVEESEFKVKASPPPKVETDEEQDDLPFQPQGRPTVRLAGQTPTHLYVRLQAPLLRQGPPPHRLHCVANVLGSGEGWKKIGNEKGYDVVLREGEGGDQYEEVVAAVDCAIESGMKFMLRGYIQNGWGFNGFNSTSNELWDSDPGLGPPAGFVQAGSEEAQE